MQGRYDTLTYIFVHDGMLWVIIFFCNLVDKQFVLKILG